MKFMGSGLSGWGLVGFGKYQVSGVGFRVSGFEFRVLSFGF